MYVTAECRLWHMMKTIIMVTIISRARECTSCGARAVLYLRFRNWRNFRQTIGPPMQAKINLKKPTYVII